MVGGENAGGHLVFKFIREWFQRGWKTGRTGHRGVYLQGAGRRVVSGVGQGIQVS